MSRSRLSFVLSSLLLVGVGAANAAPVVFQGRDADAGPTDLRPNANAARDAFVAAVGTNPLFTVTFEGLPLGYAPVLDFTTFQFSQVGTDSSICCVVSPPSPPDTGAGVTKFEGSSPKAVGYNTTSAGDTFLRFVPTIDIGTAGARLTFGSPIEYFGTFITGLGSAAGNLFAKFNDGADQVVPITGGSEGGVQFFGFTNFGKPITKLDLVLDGVIGTRDLYSLDDVMTGLRPNFVGGGGTPIPVPSTLMLATAALLAGGLARRRSRRYEV